jgi:ATP-dependent RNA helicase SUPV3L1/SUV3
MLDDKELLMKPVTSFAKQRHGSCLIYAYLGPTNTGKTHRAIERMVSLKGGMIGLPLRLLAREVYDRLCKEVSPEKVSLITGEERIIPDRAKFFVCTVESMPLEKDVPIVVVDEVQLATHPVRGHVFTDRILRARGVEETWLLGSDSMVPIIESLVPTAIIHRLQRLSKLRYKEPKQLGALPRRSAIIAFNISHLYEIAEHIRRTKGGVAVVMGSMSPQSRNAQVDLFQSGTVDYLVATDAIGMGLNLDIKHICFASLSKFDGREQRFLTVQEIGQIAGRSGRYQKDGTFGISKECSLRFSLNEPTVDAIERQVFLPVRKVYYRNSNLLFSSQEAFWKSLFKKPFDRSLWPMRDAMDERSMKFLLAQEEISQIASTPIRLSFLWEVCRIPDYRQDSDLAHFRLLSKIYKQLTQKDGLLDNAWVESQVARLSRDHRDISNLLRQMACTRTWGYIAHRSDWLHSPERWRARIAKVEQDLSERLHERLTQRFVDDCTGKVGERPVPEGVYVENDTLWSTQMTLGWLVSFSFRSNIRADIQFGLKVVRSIAHTHLKEFVQRSFKELVQTKSWTITSEFSICWKNVVLAKIIKGKSLRSPKLQMQPMEMLDPRQKTQLALMLTGWLKDQSDSLYGLIGNSSAELTIVYDIKHGLGVLEKRVSSSDRKRLAKLKITCGHRYLYNRNIFKVRYQLIRFTLYAIWNDLSSIPERPGSDVAPRVTWPKGFGRTMGYYNYAGYVIRADVVDKIRWFLRKKISSFPTDLPRDPMNWLGVDQPSWEKIIQAMGYQLQESKVISFRQ